MKPTGLLRSFQRFLFLGPFAIVFIPTIGGLIFGPIIYFFAISLEWRPTHYNVGAYMQGAVL